MKKLKILIGGLVAVVATMLTGANALAWGPASRPTYTMQSPAPTATFNSITNNAAVGDERDFVRIAEKNVGATYSSRIEIEGGKQYEVYIYFHNDASETYNTQEYNYKGVAADVKLASVFPTELNKGQSGMVSGVLSWTTLADRNTLQEVWDEAYVIAKEKVTLHYVTGSAKIYNGFATNGSVLSTNLFSPSGTYLGLNELNGVILGCDRYSGHVVYTIQTQKVEESVAPCVADPTAYGCPQYCTANPTASGCPQQLPCEKDPTAKGCPQYCATHPTDTGCQQQLTCEVNPTAKGCPQYCSANPTDPDCPQALPCVANPNAEGCPGYCSTHPTDTRCPQALPCVANPTAKGCPQYCATHPNDTDCKQVLPCVTDPNQKGCPGYCAAHPEDAGCVQQLPCQTDPTAYGCPQYCTTHPEDPGCVQALPCEQDPTAKGCPQYCATHPEDEGCTQALPCEQDPTQKGCPEYCKNHPDDEGCKQDDPDPEEPTPRPDIPDKPVPQVPPTGPAALPNTGPAEWAFAIALIVLVLGGVSYWAMMRSKLRKAHRSARGRK